jgi:hypothetical protein
MNCCAFNTPIVIDIGGNGYHLTSLDGGVQFNVFSATKKALVAWTAAGSDNAWLVLDRNSNGLIDNSTELFGNFTPQPQSAQRNGFRALAVYDDPANGGNGNGLIDDGDTVFSTLRLWRDLNHNGIADPGELLTLDAAGIRSIDLHYKEKRWRDPNGNLFRYASTVLFKDGRGPRPIFDVVLQTLPQ